MNLSGYTAVQNKNKLRIEDKHISHKIFLKLMELEIFNGNYF